MILNIEKLLACQPWAKSDFWFRTVELLHELTAKSFDLVSFVRRMYFHFYFHVAYIRFESQVFLSVQDAELQKRADRADQSVLFFLDGAIFWEKHAKNCVIMSLAHITYAIAH